MGRWLSCKDVWEAIYEKVLYQGGVDPDVLSENWTRWFFRHAFHKHSDYCYELKPQGYFIVHKDDIKWQ